MLSVWQRRYIPINKNLYIYRNKFTKLTSFNPENMAYHVVHIIYQSTDYLHLNMYTLITIVLPYSADSSFYPY